MISQKTPDGAGDEDGLALSEALFRAFPHEDLVRPIAAPHGTTTVSEAALRRCGALSEEYGALLTLHAAEMDYEMRYFADRGTTPIQFLDSIGLCHDRLLAAHCIHLTERDMDILRDRGARVAHCVGSNTKAGKGVAPIRDLAARNVPFGLGTDGPSSGNTLSLFDQMRLFAVCHKTANHDRSLFPAREIVAAATRGGAKALHAEKEFGSLRPGFKADLVLVSTKSAHMFPVYNPYSSLVYGANASDVSLVMTGGKIRVKNGRLTDFDLEDLKAPLERAMGPFRLAAQRYADMI